MRLLAFALVLGLARHAAAQVAVHVGVGARYSGTLVHDSVVTPLEICSTMHAPTVLTIREPITER